MKLLSAHFLATFALLCTGGIAFGQVQQAGHCDCNGQSGGYVGYQSCDWNGCPSCMNGNACMAGGQWNRSCQCPGGLCAGNCWTRSCLGDSCFGRCCATKAFPDSGWAPPVRYPVNYDGAWYGSYHPQAFYGTQGGGFIANYPVVYQPTDTAQMGYYYQKVPTWQTRQGMIPPVPYPSSYHARGCLRNGHGNCQCEHSGTVYTTPDSLAYRANYRPNTRPGSSPATPAKFSKRLFGSFETISLSRWLD